MQIFKAIRLNYKDEAKLLCISYALYFLGLALFKLYSDSVLSYFSFFESLIAVVLTPPIALAVLLLIVSFNFVDELDKSPDHIVCLLLLSYAIGDYTSTIQYQNMVMTTGIIFKTIFSHFSTAIVLTLIAIAFQLKAELKNIIVLYFCSTIFYIGPINLAFHFGSKVLETNAAIYTIQILAFFINYLTIRVITPD